MMLNSDFTLTRCVGRGWFERILLNPVRKGSTLLIGSSFFTIWGYDRVKMTFPQESGKRGILNHGFGGATIDEILYFYNRILYPYEPSAIVLRTGFNDILLGLTPEQTIFMFDRLITWIHTDFPNAEIVSLPIFDMPSLSDKYRPLFQPSREYNRLMAEYVEETPHLKIWDINTFFYQNPEDVGTLCGLKSFFVEDGLHITQDGYTDFEIYFRENMPHLL